MSNNTNGNSSGKSSAGDAKAPQGSSTNASSGRRASSGSGTQAPSAYRIINDGWGSRSNFQHSYGLDSTFVILHAHAKGFCGIGSSPSCSLFLF